MNSPKEIAPGQTSSDLGEALGLLETWKAVVHRSREVAEVAYSPVLRLAAASLAALADGAVHALQTVFDAFPHGPAEGGAKVYHPPLPEWRPGDVNESGD